MPLLQRRELLQRERVHLPELLVRPFGRLEPLLLLGAVERAGLVARILGVLREHLALGGERGRHELMRPVLLDEPRGLHPQLLQRLGLQLLDPHPLLGPEHFPSVHGVGELVELALEVTPLVPGGGQLLLAARLGGVGGGALLVGAVQ